MKLPDRLATFDLDGLCAAAETALRGVRAEDGRTADRPDARLVWYYQSLGLVDRPLSYAGRSAVYGYRHLLQIVAVKSAQAAGASLAQLQRALTGRTTAELEAAALDEPEVAQEAPRRLVTVELARGVLVTLDPALVDVDSVLASFTHALGGRS